MKGKQLIMQTTLLVGGDGGVGVCFPEKVFTFRLFKIAFGGFQGPRPRRLVVDLLLHVEIHLAYIRPEILPYQHNPEPFSLQDRQTAFVLSLQSNYTLLSFFDILRAVSPVF